MNISKYWERLRYQNIIEGRKKRNIKTKSVISSTLIFHEAINELLYIKYMTIRMSIWTYNEYCRI